LLEHVVLHAVVPHAYGLQLMVVAVPHWPVPVHNVAFVCVDPVHDCEPQETLLPATAHAPDPLHRPVLPQGGLAVHRLSDAVDGTFAQTPAFAPTLQA